MKDYTFLYQTVFGYEYATVEAESEEEARVLFWAEHNPDLCSILSMSSPADSQGDERAHDRAHKRGRTPRQKLREKLKPVPAPARKREEGMVDGDGALAGESDCLLVLGRRNEMQMFEVSDHALLVKGFEVVRGLRPGKEVADLSAVLSDAEEEDEQVEGDGLHAAPSGEGDVR